MLFQFPLSHLLRNRQYLPIIPPLHLISTLSWRYIFFCHHNITHSYLGYSLTYFSTTCYFLKPSKYSRCHINQNFQQPFAPQIFSATTHFLQKFQNISHRHIYFQTPINHTINSLALIPQTHRT